MFLDKSVSTKDVEDMMTMLALKWYLNRFV